MRTLYEVRLAGDVCTTVEAETPAEAAVAAAVATGIEPRPGVVFAFAGPVHDEGPKTLVFLYWPDGSWVAKDTSVDEPVRSIP